MNSKLRIAADIARRFDPTRYKPLNGGHSDKVFATAEDKAKFARDFVRFVVAGCPESRFKQPFYRRLSGCFGFIAHYDLCGFWDCRFSSPHARRDTWRQIIECPCHGDPAYTFSDVEKDIRQWVLDEHLAEREKIEIAQQTEVMERAEYARLQAKFEQG